MTAIVTALGLFYMIAAALVLRRSRMDFLMDRAASSRTGALVPDGERIAFMMGSAVLYGAAGLALVLHSHWAIYLLGAGMLIQAVHYGLLWRRNGATARDDHRRWNQAWSAAIVSMAVFAFTAYALRSGLLV